MQKTRLGISVGLMGVATYLCCLIGNYVPVVILVGYILLCEENIWLRKTAVKGLALMLAFSLITVVINLLPGALELINKLLVIFDEGFYTEDFYQVFNNIFSFINHAIGLLESVVFILLGYKAFSQGTITIPGIDTLIHKYID